MIAWQVVTHCTNMKKGIKEKSRTDMQAEARVQLLFRVAVIFEEVSHLPVLPEATLHTKLGTRERLCQ